MSCSKRELTRCIEACLKLYELRAEKLAKCVEACLQAYYIVTRWGEVKENE